MFNWLWKRILTPERVQYMIGLAYPTIEKIVIERSSQVVKDTIHKTLEDPEIGEHVIQYTDAIYDRYLGKGGRFWAQMGGMQKGINSQIDQINPLAGLFDENGNFSLANAVKTFISSRNPHQALPQSPNDQGYSETF